MRGPKNMPPPPPPRRSSLSESRLERSAKMAA